MIISEKVRFIGQPVYYNRNMSLQGEIEYDAIFTEKR